MGDGLPLGKIANNDIVELNVDFELTSAQARLLAKGVERKTRRWCIWICNGGINWTRSRRRCWLDTCRWTIFSS